MSSVTEEDRFRWKFKALQVVVAQCIFGIINIHFTPTQHPVSVELRASPNLLLHKAFIL